MLVRCRLRRGIRSGLWVGGQEGGGICCRASSWLQKHLHTSLPLPLPQGLGEFSLVFPLPQDPHPRHCHKGWGEGRGGQPQLSEGWRGWGSRARCPDGRVCGRGCPQMPSTRQSPL